MDGSNIPRTLARHHLRREVMNRVILSMGLIAASVGCASTPPPAVQPPASPVVVTSTAPVPTRRSDQQINVSEDIRRACDIDDSDRAPKFDFDSTQLAGNDRDVLAQVGRCFTTGPLKGRKLGLTGRADPRGEAEYNMNLGEARATSVRSYLANLGVQEARMSETSRGALDATGHDEATWRKDRRVDLSLLP
jgi:peptidoglycan-associated lipoprotein